LLVSLSPRLIPVLLGAWFAPMALAEDGSDGGIAPTKE
jgi:hypothetical protein